MQLYLFCDITLHGNIITVIAESPEVVVSGEGSGVAGTSYTLTCTVTLPSGYSEVVVPDPQVYKWKNHFYEMKGDVGMSLHEKERNKKMPTPRHKVTHNPIPTSLCLPRPQHNIFRRQLDVKMFCCLLCLMHS